MGTLGVVPIFVNTGVAIMPTILAAGASAAMLLFKPRELLAVLRKRPWAFVAATGIAAGLALAFWWFAFHLPVQASRRRATASSSHPDWAAVAVELIARQRIGGETTVQRAVSPAANSAAVSAQPAQQDSSQMPGAGGPSPGKLDFLWSFHPEDTLFLGAAAVGGGRVYAAGCQSDLGGYTGLLACLDGETGKPVWQITEDGGEPLRPFFSSPALTADGQCLIVGQGLHEDRDCSLLCFETANGRRRWAVKTPLHIESSPAVAGDIAVVGAGAVEGKDGKPVGDPGFCLCVRISDGRELWREPVADPESSPAIDAEGIVYIGSGMNGSAVVALRSEPAEQLAAGKLDRVVWRTPTSQPITGPVLLADDKIIVGGGNGDMVHSNRTPQGVVMALDRKTGTIVWQTPFDDAVLGRIACRDGTLICPVRTGEVIALALKDGGILWRTRVSGTAPILGGCAFAGSRIYAVSSDGFLAVLDSGKGAVSQKISLNDQAKPGTGLTLSCPRILGGRVLVGSETGGLRCLAGAGSSD
jgi:outer membrane protein assembly factor BamB